MAPGSQQPLSLSEDQMRRTWALVDVLTSLKRRGNHPPPTAELIRRKFDALSLPALDTLSILVDSTIAEQRRRLSPRQVCGMAQAVRVFPEDTALEVAHMHACGHVVSAAALKRASYAASHELRIGLVHLAEARKRGMPLSPIPTDLHAHAMNALADKDDRDGESTALKILGVGDATVQESGSFASSTGLLTGAAFCIAVLDRLNLRAEICCGSCHRIVSADELSICHQCGDHLACKGCLGHANHASECGRVRSMVRTMAQSLTPHIRESTRRVAVVELSSSGLMAPVLTTSIASPLIPSSLYESLSRCSVVTSNDLQVYWRLLISFLADQEGDEQEAIEYERVHDLQAAKQATVEPQPNASASKGPKPLPSERRRLRKELRATENRAKEAARAAAEAAAMAESDAVLKRQSARPDATSAMLTSVLLKRGGTSSPEVVARTRAKRDSLKAAEMRARKPAKIKARPERNPGERAQDALLAAALHIQQQARAWLRRRTKARRKQRSCATRHIQRSVRTWFMSRDTPRVTSSILAAVVESGNEVDDEDQSLCVVCLERPRVMLFLTCAHLCACEACASLMHACPLCRAEGSTLRVYT